MNKYITIEIIMISLMIGSATHIFSTDINSEKIIAVFVMIIAGIIGLIVNKKAKKLEIKNA